MVAQDPARVRTDLIHEAGLTQDQIEKVRRGMWKVVNEEGGTAGKARIKGVDRLYTPGERKFEIRNANAETVKLGAAQVQTLLKIGADFGVDPADLLAAAL